MFCKELVHDCSINKVPFPALESFEDRIMFPKRYFLFFDLFVRAGRHNRELWKKAIRENKGHNDKRFGPAIFEAHVRTTVRENYDATLELQRGPFGWAVHRRRRAASGSSRALAHPGLEGRPPGAAIAERVVCDAVRLHAERGSGGSARLARG